MKASLPRFLRLRSFWLGLPAFLFLLWAWRDSMIHAAALHREHGKPVEKLWPPPEVVGEEERPPEPLPQVIEAVPFDLEQLGSVRKDPVAELLPRWVRFTASKPEWGEPFPWEDPWRWGPCFGSGFYGKSDRSLPMEVRSYRSAGSHAGALWWSSWSTPQQMDKQEYLPATLDQSWFPAPEWGEKDLMLGHTLRLPYWLLAGAYLGAWGLLMRWRLRRRAWAEGNEDSRCREHAH